MKKEKKKGGWKKVLWVSPWMLLGYIGGILIGKYVSQGKTQGIRSLGGMGGLVLLVLGIGLALMIQIIIHEAGHLVFGLMSGYRFSSFRIMSFMWIKQEGKVKVKKYTLAGTGGQCLMSPPDMVDGRFPITLYNLGGSIMNIIASALFGVVCLLTPGGSVCSKFCFILTMIGIAFAVINGVPMHMGLVDNDGYNAFSLGKNKEALWAFWLQLKINEEISKGVRLKDMPDEWFVFSKEEELQNTMIATMNVFCCNRLMDQHKFEEGNGKMKHLLDLESGIAGIHRNMLICDCIYCELLEGNPQEAARLMTKEQKSFMKSMKQFPSILRTNYVYALMGEEDAAKAQKYKTAYEKCAKTYPYPSDIQSERELMELAERMEISRGFFFK